MSRINTIKAANVDLKHYSGDVFDLWVAITNSDDTPYDMDGKSLVMQIKRKKTSSTSLMTLQTPNEITVSGTDNNEIKCDKVITLPEALDEKAYYYDIENVTDHVTILKGKFEVEGDVTRTTTEAPTTT